MKNEVVCGCIFSKRWTLPQKIAGCCNLKLSCVHSICLFYTITRYNVNIFDSHLISDGWFVLNSYNSHLNNDFDHSFLVIFVLYDIRILF